MLYIRLYRPFMADSATGFTKVLIPSQLTSGSFDGTILESMKYHDTFYMHSSNFGRAYIEGEDALRFNTMPCTTPRAVEDGEEFLVTQNFHGAVPDFAGELREIRDHLRKSADDFRRQIEETSDEELREFLSEALRKSLAKASRISLALDSTK